MDWVWDIVLIEPYWNVKNIHVRRPQWGQVLERGYRNRATRSKTGLSPSTVSIKSPLRS